jgi:hypothetical protein
VPDAHRGNIRKRKAHPNNTNMKVSNNNQNDSSTPSFIRTMKREQILAELIEDDSIP